MARFLDPAPGGLPPLDSTPEREIVRQIGAWTPPTPRWRDSAARARIAKQAAARQPAPITLFSRVRQRLDLIGWILGQSADGLLPTFEDPSDPRVILYNRISGLSYRHSGPQGVLLRYVAAGI